jgi:hypothetical protein
MVSERRSSLRHPSARLLRFIDRLGDLSGRPAAVFPTYKLAVGGSLREMALHLEARGARVTGRLRSRGAFVADGFEVWLLALPPSDRRA